VRQFFKLYITLLLSCQVTLAHVRDGFFDLQLFTDQNAAIIEKFVLTQGPQTTSINAVPRFENTINRFLKNSKVFIDDEGNITINGITKDGNTILWPSTLGPNGSYLASNGTSLIWVIPPVGTGNVNTVNPFMADNRITRTDTVSGATNIQESAITIDDSGNMSGINTLTATTINANVVGNIIGSASLNVLKSGDDMTGNLNMLNQTEIRFHDGASGYVGLHAPSLVSPSYTLALPATSPLASQSLRANILTPTQLEWFTSNTNVNPSISNVIYVATYGNDATGNGSLDSPYASLAKAIDVANSLSSLSNPITIVVNSGVYIEDNSAGPLEITAEGINVTGLNGSGTFIIPANPANPLLSVMTGTNFFNLTFVSTGGSTAPCFICNTTNAVSTFYNVLISGFDTGMLLEGSNATYFLNFCLFDQNQIGVSIDDVVVLANNCSFRGTGSSTGVLISGANSQLFATACTFAFCSPALEATNNAHLTLLSGVFRANANSFTINTSATLTLQSSSFELDNSLPTVVDIIVDGAGTRARISACIFNGNTSSPNSSTVLQVTDQATVLIDSSQIDFYTNGLIIGTPTDTIATQLEASGVIITNTVNDIIQNGLAKLNFVGGTADSSKIIINDHTNTNFAYFDLDDNDALTIGPGDDEDFVLIDVNSASANEPRIAYKSSLYGTPAIGMDNTENSNPITSYALAQDAAYFAAITQNRDKVTGLRFVSDTGSPVGTFAALRGWTIDKNATTAELNFAYQNSDSFLLSTTPLYTVMQLDGTNNQLQLPTAGTQIVFAGDTNLYRSAANILKTDDNVIIGGLTANRVVTTDANKQLVSSAVTDAELTFLSGAIASLQTQIDAKVAKAGDIMTGTLQLPSGSPATPSLTFTGSTTTGLSANSNTLSLDTSGQERMTISSAGTVAINDLTPAGVVHNDLTGNLSTSLIVNADVAAGAGIVDTKLATISTAGKVNNSATTGTSSNIPNSLVLRDSSGNFSAGTITANFIGSVTGSASNNVLITGDTMLGALTLPAGTVALPSLRFTGSTNTGISAGTPNTLAFSTNSAERLSIDPTGIVSINDLATTGLVHTNGSGQLSTSLLVDADITLATIANNKLATISSNNTSGAIVVRDGSGNFAANMITLFGTTSNATDVATKAYVDSTVSGGLVAKTPAVVVATTNIILSGIQTIDGVLLVANDRVLLVGQTNPVENGLWLVQAGAWTRPADFATGTAAGQAYVLILSGAINAGTSWLSNTPAAIIDTDPITFSQFSLADTTTGANVGTGAGQVFRNKSGVTLNFRTLAAGLHMNIINNADDINFSTDATSANTPNTIVARDASGNFSANTITANIIGTASGNIANTGGSMSGTLSMLTQNQIQFQDAAGGEYVGLQAPAIVPSSYTVALPANAPLAGQVLHANSTTPTNSEWFSLGTSALPAASKAIYVAKYGNDTTGDGSQNAPYLTLSKAISVANSISSSVNPITILIEAGIYVENNNAGPLSITANGIAIVGSSRNVTIIPSSLTNDLLSITTTTQLQTLTFRSASLSSGNGVVLSGIANLSFLDNVTISNFAIGLLCGGTGSIYKVSTCFFVTNGIGVSVQDNVNFVGANCLFQGGTTSPANIGITLTGSNCIGSLLGGIGLQCSTFAHVTNGSELAVRAGLYSRNVNDFIADTGGHLLLQSCVFEPRNNSIPVAINIQATDVGTTAKVIGCVFDGAFLTPGTDITAVQVTNQASCIMSSGEINHYKNALIVGTPSDTASTSLEASSIFINNCTNDIIQQGSSTLNLNASTASSTKIFINDPTNVHLAYFDLTQNNALTIGSLADEDFTLIAAGITPTNTPDLAYKSSLYGAQSIGFDNTANGNPAAAYSVGQSSSYLLGITTDRTQISGMRLVSDTASPLGTLAALRGWNIYKKASSAELAFDYSNSDTTGQSAVASYTVAQFDGVNNQVQLPDASTQLVFGGDTNLYRGAANILQTDDNIIIGGLTANRVVTTNGAKQLVSSTVTDAELGNLAGTTSSLQTQIDGKVSKSGDIMTGTLQLPAGTPAAPSLVFTGSTTTGLSASSNTLSFNTSGVEHMAINASGTVSINNFTTAGVVHNNALGDLSSSLIVNSDIAAAANISDTKLATISTAGKVSNSATTATSSLGANTIVMRDASNNFSANIITANLNGNATTATSTTSFSGSLSGDVTGTQTATVVSLVGGQTAANVATGTVAANAATDANTPNTIVKRDASGNFSAGIITANLSGNATTATNTTNFTGSLSGDVTGTQGATVVSSVGGQTAANVATATIAANAATNLNTASTIVKRDASGNFSAGTITANLNGNATTATTATTATNFSGSLSGDVTGTQGATVVSTVGGQTAANVATATIAANAATNLNTASTIVKRDASGNFSAGTITANLNGNATTATTATTATNATNFTGSLSGDVTGTQGATVVSTVGGQTAANVATATIAANAATDANTASTIVKRDASGNFSAGTITAALNGNATTATTATTATNATTAVNFSGSLSGNVTGTQGATVVSTVGGQTAANVATATIAANAATNLNTASTIVKRDASGNFSAGTITANLNGNATTATTATTATNFTGSLSGDVTGTQGATVVSTVGGQTAANVATATIAANAATNLNTASTIVRRDASGNFSAGTITAALNGNATTATSATTATTATNATNFTGSLSGDVTGTQGATVVSTVGGQTAANVATATIAANAATNLNTANTIVRRDASGNFSAGTITAALIGAASLNVLKSGDVMTGALELPAGTSTVPSLRFTGSTTTGLSAATANVLSFITNGQTQATVDATTFKITPTLIASAAFATSAIVTVVPTVGGSTTVANTTAILLLKPAANVGGAGFTVNFPSTPQNGQYFTIMLGTAFSVILVNSGGANTIFGGITTLNTAQPTSGTVGGSSVSYIYSSTDTTWYRFRRG